MPRVKATQISILFFMAVVGQVAVILWAQKDKEHWRDKYADFCRATAAKYEKEARGLDATLAEAESRWEKGSPPLQQIQAHRARLMSLARLLRRKADLDFRTMLAEEQEAAALVDEDSGSFRRRVDVYLNRDQGD